MKVDDVGEEDEPPPQRELKKKQKRRLHFSDTIISPFFSYLSDERLIDLSIFVFFYSVFRMKRVHRPSLEGGFFISFFWNLSLMYDADQFHVPESTYVLYRAEFSYSRLMI